MKNALDLTDGWAFQALDPLASATDLVGVTVEDSAWKQVSLGIFSLPDHPELRHAVIRKHIQIPAAWNHGQVTMHLPDFRSSCQVYLDGQPLRDWSSLTGGSTHTVAIELKSNNDFLGANNPAWLSYQPDMMTWIRLTPIPGEVAEGTRALRTLVNVDRAAAAKTVVIHSTQRGGNLNGVVINGTYVSPYTNENPSLDLNITPWILPGRQNDIVLMMGGGAESINSLALEFYEKGTYP
jgi:hypothetical protein